MAGRWFDDWAVGDTLVHEIRRMLIGREIIGA